MASVDYSSNKLELKGMRRKELKIQERRNDKQRRIFQETQRD